MRQARLRSVAILVLIVALFGVFAHQGVMAEDTVEDLKKQLLEMQKNMNKLTTRIDQLEKKKADTKQVTRVEESVKSIQKSPSILNPSIGLAIDATFAHQDKTGGNFSLRAAELGIAAEIDPYARAYAFVTGSDEGVELEEAAMITTSLPYNLTGTGGKFFADFGRLAKFHQHELPFVNFPISLERMVGGESVAIGVQWNYLFPTPFFLSFTAGGYNKIGEENERLDNAENRSMSRFTYLSRLHSFVDLTETMNLEMGATLSYTPRVDFADGAGNGDRSLSGIDMTFRHRPLIAGFYEGMTVAGEFFANSERFEEVGRQISYGGYGYAQVELNPEILGRWDLGLLLDSAPDLENPAGKTTSLSSYISWWPSEFNRLRLQYTYGWDDVGENAAEVGNQIYVQWTTVIGSHTHGFRDRQ